MRILYVSSSKIPSRDANSVHVMRMCDALSGLGHDVTLLSRRTAENLDGVHGFYGTTHRFRVMRRRWPRSRLGGARYALGVLGYLLAHRRPDLVYGRSFQGLLVVSALGLPCIYESHAPPGSRWRSIGEHILLRRRSLNALVVISRALEGLYGKILARVPALPVIVAPDGANLPPAGVSEPQADWPGRSGVLQAGYTGHLYEGRGIDLLLRLGEARPDFDIHIIGGTDEDIARWRTENPPGNVHFHGFVPPAEVDRVLARCDVLLAPYQRRVAVRGGGDTGAWMSPLKLFEYMAAGRAIVASRLPAIEEILEDGRTALLVEPEDLSAWAEALDRLSDADLRARLGRYARDLVEARYTWRRRAQRILEETGCVRPTEESELRRIRVLHVLSSSGIGGTEVSTLRLARETRDRLETAFLVLSSRGPISEAIERAGFPIVHVPASSLLTAVRALPAIVRILRNSDAQIVHTYGLRAHLLVRILGRLAGGGCIVGGLRSLAGTSSRGKCWLWLDWLTFPLSCGYVSNSDAAIERFAANGYPRSRMWWIHNGVDLDQFGPAAPDERQAARAALSIAGDRFVVACVASLRAVKNHRLLLQAVGRLDDRTLLLLIGDGPLRTDLERDARDLGVEGRVRFVGPVATDELPRVLGACDLCVLASDSEGLPTSLLEAMACGLPVVATRVGGVPELVIDGETGVLVPRGDVEALTEAVRSVLGDDRLRERMGKAGRGRAEQAFGLRRMADAYVELYEKLVSDAGA